MSSFTESITAIDPKLCVGNTLSTINSNFDLLDYKLSNIALSADQIWNNLYTLAATTSGDWQDAVAVVRSSSANWDDTYTIVSSYSSCWLRPISLIFPLTPDNNAINQTTFINSISSWLNSNFPVTSIVDNATVSNYCPGQEIFVFTLGFFKDFETVAPDTRFITAKCNAAVSWSYRSCSIRGRCVTNTRTVVGYDRNNVGNINDNRATGFDAGGGASVSLLSQVVGLENLNTSIVNYIPAVYPNYYKFVNTTGSRWQYITTKPLST